MAAEIVPVEGDRRPVRILKAFLRLKGLYQNIAVDQIDRKAVQEIVQIGGKDRLSVPQLHVHRYLMLRIHQIVRFLPAGLRSVEINVSFHPDRQMSFVRRLQLRHVRGVRIHVELADPFLPGGVLVHHMGARLPVFLIGAFPAVAQDGKGLGRPFLHENIIVKTIVAVQDGHEAHHLRAVRDMVGRIARSGAAAHAGERAADQVVDHGDALGRHPQGRVRQKDIVVDQRRAVSHLHENILAHHAAL